MSPPVASCGIDKAAVDVSTGDVYVVDNQHDAIDKFDASGNFLAQITGGSTTAGTFDFGAGNENQIAVDNSGTATQGNLYVVSELSSFSGPAPGSQPAIFAFDRNGNELWERASFNTVNPDTCGVAVDPQGNPWVADYAAQVVQEYNAADGTLGSGSVSTAGQSNFPCEIAFDAVGSLCVNSWHTTCTSPSVTNPCSVTVNEDLTVTVTFGKIQHTVTVNKSGSGSGTVTSSPAGISCGGTCSALFDEGSSPTLTAAASPGSTFTGWSGGGCSGTGTCSPTIDANTTVTATFTANAPTAVTGSATGVGDTVATLGGSVNPAGHATSCHFDYGTTTAYGSVAPCATSPGSGTSSIAVSASLTGLAAGTTYHFRLVASNGGGTSTGSDATFTTTSPPPPPATCPQDLTKCPPPTVKLAGFSGSTLLLRLGCTGFTGQTCSGRLTFKAVVKVRMKHGKKTKLVKKTITVAAVSYSVPAGGTQSLKLKLTSAAKVALKSGGVTARAGGLNGSIHLPKTKVRKHKKRR